MLFDLGCVWLLFAVGVGANVNLYTFGLVWLMVALWLVGLMVVDLLAVVCGVYLLAVTCVLLAGSWFW